MRIEFDHPRYFRRFDKKVSIDFVEAIYYEACKEAGLDYNFELMPNLVLYRDKYELKARFNRRRVAYGLYSHYDKTIHISVHDATKKIVAWEMGRFIAHLKLGRKPSSETSRKWAQRIRSLA